MFHFYLVPRFLGIFYIFKKFEFNILFIFLLLSCFSTHIHLLQFLSAGDCSCLHGVSLRVVVSPHETLKLTIFQMYHSGANSFCMYTSAMDIILNFPNYRA